MGYLGTYQDYFWFLGGLCWLTAGLAWWRLELDRIDWAWLPWCAVAGVISAGTQVCCWIIVGKAAPLTPPLLRVDLFLGAVAAVAIAGWWRLPHDPLSPAWQRHARSAAGLLGLIVAAQREAWPQLGAAALALSALGAAISGGAPNRRRPPSVRWALGATLAALVFSNWGPLAGTAFDSMRWADLAAPAALAVSVVALLTAGVVLICVLREPLQRHFARSEREARREAVVLGTALIAWLSIGLAIAHLAGSSTRRGLETAALSRVRIGALLLDKHELSACLGPEFRLDKHETFQRLQGGVMHRAISTWLVPERTHALVAALTAITRANPDTEDVFVSTLKDGWVVGAVFTERPKPLPTVVSLERPAAPADYELWQSRKVHFSTVNASAFGTSVQAWAPLVGSRNEMLGWLVMDWDTKGWIAAQSLSRLQTFAVVALGVGLCVLLSLHRLVHRQSEAAALRGEAAAAANRLKTTFLASVSHELRTPLQAIRGYSEMLEQRQQSVTARPLFAAMRSQVEVMHRLVADLLDLSAMEAGGFRCERQPVDVARLVADLAVDGQRAAQQKGLEFRREIAPELPVLLLGDAVRLRQVCGNLISNAVKYTDDGEVSVRVTVERRERGFCDFAVIVDDTGPGIPEERRAALFQPFSRLDATGVKEGSGLGLALASGLARNLGGELRLDQSGPEGSRFALSLRWEIAPSCPPPTVGSSHPEPAGKRLRVLVVDDSPVIGVLFVEFLRDCGAQCELAADGAVALDLLVAGNFDAAVIDISLPGLSGYEVARRLRAHGGQRPPIRLIGVSAHAGENERRRALESDMADFLVKPVELAALARALGLPPAAPSGHGMPEALMEQLTTLFRQDLPQSVQRTERALAERDWAAVVVAVHQIANGAFALQAAPLNRACRELEQAARTGDAAAVFPLWSEVLTQLSPWLATEPHKRGL